MKIPVFITLLLSTACNNNASFAPANQVDLRDVLWYEAMQPLKSTRQGTLIIQTDVRTDTLHMDASQLNSALTTLQSPYVKYDVNNYRLYGSKTQRQTAKTF